MSLFFITAAYGSVKGLSQHTANLYLVAWRTRSTYATSMLDVSNCGSRSFLIASGYFHYETSGRSTSVIKGGKRVQFLQQKSYGISQGP